MKRRKRELLPEPEPLRHDPIEDTGFFRSVIAGVEQEAESRVEGSIRVGRLHLVELEKKRILKEQYGIDWKTTEEMNPAWDFC